MSLNEGIKGVGVIDFYPSFVTPLKQRGPKSKSKVTNEFLC